MLVKDTSTLQPEDLLSLLNDFIQSNEIKDKIVKDLLQLMREDKYDIRAFNF